MTNHPIPEGFHTVTATVVCRNCEEALSFYERAFGAIRIGEVVKLPSGQVVHAEIRIGDSIVFLCDEMAEMGLSASTARFYCYLPDVDAAFTRAIQEGCTLGGPLVDTFYGDRCGHLQDPYGHSWTLASRVSNPTPEEIKAGAERMFAGGGMAAAK